MDEPVHELHAVLRRPAGSRHVARRLSAGLPLRSDDVCQRTRAHPGRHRRPRDGGHRQGPAPRPHLHEPHDAALPRLLRVLRHGGDDRAHRVVLPARRAGAGGEEADPLPARPRRRRQVVAGRAPEGPDRTPPRLRAQGRQRPLPGVREPARPLRPRDDGRADRGPLRGPATTPHRADEPLGAEAPRRVQRRHLQVQGRQGQSLAPAPDRTGQDRARRREQPGHLVTRRQGRHPQAREPFPGRPRRLFLLRAASTAPIRACSNSSRCSRRRSRCCIRC